MTETPEFPEIYKNRIIPCHKGRENYDGNKKPIIKWKTLKDCLYPTEKLKKHEPCNYYAITKGLTAVADFDDGDSELIWKEITENSDTMIVETPTGGFHVHFKQKGEFPKKDWSIIGNLKFGLKRIDIRVNNLVMMPPSENVGTFHNRGGKKVEVEKIHDDYAYLNDKPINEIIYEGFMEFLENFKEKNRQEPLTQEPEIVQETTSEPKIPNFSELRQPIKDMYHGKAKPSKLAKLTGEPKSRNL